LFFIEKWKAEQALQFYNDQVDTERKINF